MSFKKWICGSVAVGVAMSASAEAVAMTVATDNPLDVSFQTEAAAATDVMEEALRAVPISRSSGSSNFEIAELTVGGAGLPILSRSLSGLASMFHDAGGFAYLNAPLNFADNDAIVVPVQQATSDRNGASDAALIASLNGDDSLPAIPLPASAPLFLAGIVMWRRLARRKKPA